MRLRTGQPLALAPTANPERLPLLPWQFEFAEWLAREHAYTGKRVPIREQLEKLNELSQRHHTARYLRALKLRDEFREFFAELQKEALTRARAKAISRAPKAVEAHYEGLAQAVEAGDYRAIPSYTVPVLDRVWPKRADGIAVAAVKIELSPKQQKLLESEIASVECEVLDDSDTTSK